MVHLLFICNKETDEQTKDGNEFKMEPNKCATFSFFRYTHVHIKMFLLLFLFQCLFLVFTNGKIVAFSHWKASFRSRSVVTSSFFFNMYFDICNVFGFFWYIFLPPLFLYHSFQLISIPCGRFVYIF